MKRPDPRRPVMGFKNAVELQIAEKMLKFPLLGEQIDGKWNVSFTREFDLTKDSRLFNAEPGKGLLPLYEGKMIHQFRHGYAAPRYWIMEQEGRAALLKRGEAESGQRLAYQSYRLGFRDSARPTDERKMICCILPKEVFAGNTLFTTAAPLASGPALTLAAVFDSLAFDFFIRHKTTARGDMLAACQVPVPRLTEKDAAFCPIVERAARLTCTTPVFDDLANEIFGGRAGAKTVGAIESGERAELRAELDALVAQRYGLTEGEFVHILTTFPLVSEAVKSAARRAFRHVEKGLVK